MSMKDYTTRHPLSFLEKDVYICDNKYDESTHKFSKLSESRLYLSVSFYNVSLSVSFYNVSLSVSLCDVSLGLSLWNFKC